MIMKDRYDVLVVGGGAAGVGAAVGAAKTGARVGLLEAAGCLGGFQVYVMRDHDFIATSEFKENLAWPTLQPFLENPGLLIQRLRGRDRSPYIV